jgi:hypothetical protein
MEIKHASGICFLKKKHASGGDLRKKRLRMRAFREKLRQEVM